MMKIGIEKISFFTPGMYVDMKELAQARGVDPNKYLIGIGQSKMAVIPPTQDVVSMGANAASRIINKSNINDIDTVLVATESGIDNSKAAAVYIADLLGLSNSIRAIELKQACYSGAYALQIAKDHVATHPEKKVLVIASDISRYGIKVAGEPTQGGGAVAILVSTAPQILAIDDDTAFHYQNIMDFWRPLGKTEALVDGKYSTNVYIDFFKTVVEKYYKQTGRTIYDFSAFLFHLPFTKQGLKALRVAVENCDEKKAEQLMEAFEASRTYNMNVGNLYTGSIFLSLISLIENSNMLKGGDRIGFYSYGSGAQAEFFSCVLSDDYRQHLIGHNDLLDNRRKVTVEEYEKVFNSAVKFEDNISLDISNDNSAFVFCGVRDCQRQYLRREL